MEQGQLELEFGTQTNENHKYTFLNKQKLHTVNPGRCD